MGWDGIDVLKASAYGWRTGIVPGSRFPAPPRRGEPRRRSLRTVDRTGAGCALHGLPAVVSRAPCAAACDAGSRRSDDDSGLAQAGACDESRPAATPSPGLTCGASSGCANCRSAHARRTGSDPDDRRGPLGDRHNWTFRGVGMLDRRLPSGSAPAYGHLDHRRPRTTGLHLLRQCYENVLCRTSPTSPRSPSRTTRRRTPTRRSPDHRHFHDRNSGGDST